MRIHIGKKAPKGYRELPGGVHLGKGIWMLRVERIPPVIRGTASDLVQHKSLNPVSDDYQTVENDSTRRGD